MDTLRAFTRWLESTDGVEQDTHAESFSPPLSGNDTTRDVMLDEEQAEQGLARLRTYEYCSRRQMVSNS